MFYYHFSARSLLIKLGRSEDNEESADERNEALMRLMKARNEMKLERVGRPQPQSCPPAWEQDEMLINE